MALGRMVIGFITVIVGASLVPTLVTIINSASSELRETITGNGQDNLVNLTNVSSTDLGIVASQPSASCSNLVIINSTGGEAIAQGGNYSFNSAACNFIMNDSSPYVGGQGNLTYDYSYSQLSAVNSSSASLLELTILFFSLAVMIAGVGTSVAGLVEYGLV